MLLPQSPKACCLVSERLFSMEEGRGHPSGRDVLCPQVGLSGAAETGSPHVTPGCCPPSAGRGRGVLPGSAVRLSMQTRVRGPQLRLGTSCTLEEGRGPQMSPRVPRSRLAGEGLEGAEPAAAFHLGAHWARVKNPSSFALLGPDAAVSGQERLSSCPRPFP